MEALLAILSANEKMPTVSMLYAITGMPAKFIPERNE